MMQSLEAACEEGEVSSITSCQCDQRSNSTINIKSNMVCTHSRHFKRAKTSRTSLPLQPNQDSVPIDIPTPKPQFCIHTRLSQLHLEECANDPNLHKTGLKRNSHLLEKLVAQERLNKIILNLYPGYKGYSLSFPRTPVTDTCMEDTAEMLQSKMWPYDNEELLSYINNEELPAFFIDLLEPQYSFLFYSGCIIAEVRDHRQAYPALKCDIYHVLLKPTLQSILADVNGIVDERVDWGTEEKLQLESQILMANSPNLCLDPKSSISSTTSRINHNRQILNTHRLRRAARRSSFLVVKGKKKLIPHTHRPGLELFDFITHMHGRPKLSGLATSKFSEKLHEEVKQIQPIPIPSLDPPQLNPPIQGVQIEEFKAYKEDSSAYLYQPQLVEEFDLEPDMHSKDKGKRVYYIKLSILQRPSNGEYLGELYLDQDHKKGERNGVTCRFSLGTRAHANKYIQQFKEIFTEGGRKSVRINYRSYQSLKDRMAQVHAAQIQNQHVPQVNLAQQHLAQLNQNLQSQQCAAPLVNGTLNSAITLLQQNQSLQNPGAILQAHLQSTAQMKVPSQQISTKDLEVSALENSLRNSAEQYEASANAKQQAKLTSSGNNPAIINLLNSSPVSNINSDASAAVVNAINNSTLLPQQVQTINQKLLGRKITASNIQSARVLNHSNLITVNNNRVNLSDLSSSNQQPHQGQTITLTTVNSANFTQANYTTVSVKQPMVNQRVISDDANSRLSALLVGTPAADRPDIIGTNANTSLLVEKLAGASGASPNPAQSPTNFIQSPKPAQYTVQSPKNNPVMSPLSSPPPQNAHTINEVNFAPLFSLSGFQNLLVQGHSAGFLVTIPVTTGTATATTAGQIGNNVSFGTSLGVATPTVIFANAGTAQLVTSGVKSLTQQTLRTATPSGVTLAQGGQQFQQITPLQRPRVQQTSASQSLSARSLQRTPITIKMAATPQANVSQVTNSQKQAQVQHYQETYLNQQQKNLNISRMRRSNLSEHQ